MSRNALCLIFGACFFYAGVVFAMHVGDGQTKILILPSILCILGGLSFLHKGLER